MMPFTATLLVLGCVLCTLDFIEPARVKRSVLETSWHAPNDSAASWPSPDQVYYELGQSLQGDVYLPGSVDYRNRTIMKNLRFRANSGAVVFAESTKDVQEALLFARRYGIRPTVYSTGHDFLGRSARDHTLAINMARMKQLEVNLGDSRSDTNMTMTLGTGVNWGQAYQAADEYGAIVLGGSSPTVSPGGFILGGGHSPITRTHGLGVDQVIEFTLVTGDGDIVYMTEHGGTVEHPDGSTEPVTDPDFWWAVLGGGGGVFGVVTEFVLKLHPPPDGFLQHVILWPITAFGPCEGVATEALEILFDLARTNMSTNWGGYILMGQELDNPFYHQGYLLFSLVHWGGDVDAAMGNIAEFTNFRPDCQYMNEVLEYDTFWGYQQTIEDTYWVRGHIIGTMLQEEDLEPGSGAAEMVTNMVNATEFENLGIGCTGILTGGNARDFPEDGTSTSPEFRNGLVSMGCGLSWYGEDQDTTYITALLQYANEHMYQYGTGVYYNENDYYLQDWQVEFWASQERYERLLGVKQRWDPDNVFWCHHCVGSEFI